MSNLEIITKEINSELDKKEIQNALLSTTFKGFSLLNLKKALFEGMARGFTFKDFLEKNVYAIGYGDTYSLITSIDYARKLGMRNGVVGVGIPVYVEDDKGNIISCSITVKKDTKGIIGEFTSLVYFNEFNTTKNLWKTKPRVMIAKVAEMHALRKACPEELAKAYVEEEMEKEIQVEQVDETLQKKIDEIKTIPDLKKFCDENKGGGKELAKAIIAKKKLLEDELTKKPDVKNP